MSDFLTGKKNIHFIGAGGSGMFPLEQILIARGFSLTGSDNNETETLGAARKAGVSVFNLGHSAENVHGADAVIFSGAINDQNPEIAEAKRLGIPVYERSELLGAVSAWYKNCVAVAGTHGKTTTTAMIVNIFLAAGIDVSCVIGGKFRSIGGYGRAGGSDTIIIEACEFRDTFLRLKPSTSVILNIDEDHLDYFGTLDNLKASFRKFADLTSAAVCFNGADRNTLDVIGQCDQRKTFIDFTNGEREDLYKLLVPGRHNQKNALAAAAAARCLGVPEDAIRRGIETFGGVGRRFEVLEKTDAGVTIADDYAHHPAEVDATLRAAREAGYQRIIAVHQPFTYSRTARLMNDFADALKLADKVLLTEIMGGRETDTLGASSAQLAEKIPGAEVLPDFETIAARALELAQPGDLIITMGCGDVYKAARLMY